MSTPCIEWEGPRNNHGYGYASKAVDGTHLAHRIMWMLVNGPVPDGMVIRHTCDNPPCVNPLHLLVGSRKDNARDMVERDRWNNQHKGKPIPDRCVNGHPITDEALTNPGKGRRWRCRECFRIRDRAYKQKMRSNKHG